MRVLHVNINYTGTSLHQLMVEKLDELGCCNQVFVPTYDKSMSVIVPNKNVTICECFKKFDRVLFNYKQHKIFEALKRNYEISAFDLVHAYTLFSDGNCARKVMKKFGIPYVVAVRNTDVYDFFRLMPHLRNRGIKIMLDAKAVCFLSDSYRDFILKKYIPTRYHKAIMKKSYVIPNGIDEFWLSNACSVSHNLGEEIKLLYVGRICSNKNIASTQKAMELLIQKGYNVSLTVVGPVEDEKVYDEIKSDAHTTFLPPKPKEELIEIYRQHDMFVMPSFTESFGLVYAEAMSQGLPVIYSKGQGFDNQFYEGYVGYHVSPHNVQDIADGISKLIVNYEFIKNNVVEASKKFNWTDISEKYVEIYRQ